MLHGSAVFSQLTSHMMPASQCHVHVQYLQVTNNSMAAHKKRQQEARHSRTLSRSQMRASHGMCVRSQMRRMEPVGSSSSSSSSGVSNFLPRTQSCMMQHPQLLGHPAWWSCVAPGALASQCCWSACLAYPHHVPEVRALQLWHNWSTGHGIPASPGLTCWTRLCAFRCLLLAASHGLLHTAGTAARVCLKGSQLGT
jgi:hypothetical protein